MQIGNRYFSRDRVTTLIIIGIFALLLITYLFIKYSEQIMIGFLVIVGVILLIVALNSLNQPKKFRSPEEELAYRRRKAELEAEKDFHEEGRRPKYSDFGPSPLFDMLHGGSSKKKRRRY